MKLENIKLPSNRKFGFFFTFVFCIAACYFFYIEKHSMSLALGLTGLIFFLVTITKDILLLPLNRLWMRLGLLLGRIVSPIVLAVLFFLMFAPIGIFMRIFGRDELRLKKLNHDSFWKLRDQSDKASSSFTQQF